MINTVDIENLGWPIVGQHWNKLPKWLVNGKFTYDNHPSDLAIFIAVARKIQAKNIVDISTSSGCRAGYIIDALKKDKINPTVYGVDLGEFTHFDTQRSIGQVVYEVFPEHKDNFKLFSLSSSFDFDEILDNRKIDLAIIDGKYPWPCIDLLFLTPYLDKNSVVLVNRCSSMYQSPQEKSILFEKWDGPKYEFQYHYTNETLKEKYESVIFKKADEEYNQFSEETHANFVALQMHDNIDDTLNNLLNILSIRWKSVKQPELSLYKSHAEAISNWLNNFYGEKSANLFDDLVDKVGTNFFQSQKDDGSWLFQLRDRELNSYLKYITKLDINLPFLEDEIPVIKNICEDKEKSITVCFAASKDDLKYLGVTLRSLVENLVQHTFCDVVILSYQISQQYQDELNDEFKSYQDLCSIRFVDLSSILYCLLNNRKDSNIEILTYAKIFAIQVFSSYEKYLFLDNNLIINTDLSELYNINIKNMPLVGMVDEINYYPGKQLISENSEVRNVKDYISGYLGIRFGEYINLGISLWSSINITKLERFKLYHLMFCDFEFGVQDVINLTFQNRKIIHETVWDFNIQEDDINSKQMLQQRIVHYVDLKPWESDNTKLGEIWWQYARKMSYYEVLLNNFILSNLIQIKQVNQPHKALHYPGVTLPKRDLFSETQKTTFVERNNDSDVSYVTENSCKIEPVDLDYHTKVVSIKEAFQIIKAGCVHNNPKLKIFLRPLYKVLKKPAKFFTKKFFIRKILN